MLGYLKKSVFSSHRIYLDVKRKAMELAFHVCIATDAYRRAIMYTVFDG